MAQDPDYGEDHPGEIAVCVSNKDFGGVPIVDEEGEGDADEWEEHV